jgi:hypothetical protein
MRGLYKSWQNHRPGWTRRIRWYNGDTIRLQVDEREMINNVSQGYVEGKRQTYHAVFNSATEAQIWYDRYIDQEMQGREWWWDIKAEQEG